MMLPFKFTIKGLLLSGKDREKARIEYELKGEEKERALLAVEYDTTELRTLKDYRIKKLELDKKYDKINDMDYELEINKVNVDGKSDNDVKINELDILLKYGKISGVDYCKQKNDILEKPWVAIRTNPEMDDSDNLEIEVTYNKTFIKNMKAKGFPGDTDEEIAEQWLKHFLVANLDDDLRMIDEDIEEESSQIPTRHKISDKATFLG